MKKDASVIGKIIEKNKCDEINEQKKIIEKLKEKGLIGAKQE